MPAVAAIVLANSEETPVNHTFAPIGQNPTTGYWAFEDRSPRNGAVNALGWPRIAIRTRRASEAGPGVTSSARINRVEFSIAMPQVETLGVDATPTVSHIDRFNGSFLLPERDTSSERLDLLVYAYKLMSTDANFLALVQDLANLY